MSHSGTVVMPFGKFAGLPVPLVYEQQPSYVAWFHETVQGFEDIKEAIRGLEGIESHLTAFRQRPRQQQSKRQPPNPLSSTQQEAEWLTGKFSTKTIDALCNELFWRDG
jgi:hypothetical protein